MSLVKGNYTGTCPVAGKGLIGICHVVGIW